MISAVAGGIGARAERERLEVSILSALVEEAIAGRGRLLAVVEDIAGHLNEW